MSERAPLLALLRQVRRRLRVLAAVDGAVRGAALGLGALTVALVVTRFRGGPVGVRAAIGLVAALTLAGAAALALRRIALSGCARLVDRALDDQDRVLSALSFVDAGAGREPTGILARAAVADALERARVLSPARVAPARRPRGLAVLGAAALAATVSAVAPSRAPAARLDVGAARPLSPGEPRLKLAESRLEAEKDEARRAADEANALDDDELRAVARDFDAAIRSLTDGTLTRGDALERLKALAERAAEAGERAEARRDALRAAGRALEESTPTRPAGAALAADDTAAAERTLGALAARAAEASAAERNKVAQAFDAAAAQAAAAAAAAAAGTTGEANPSAAAERRLKRDRPSGASSPSGAPKQPNGDRRLERLRRDLAETASACRDNPEACRKRLSERAEDLPRMAREARKANVWKRVENGARQMRDRLRRGDLGGRDKRMAERRFMRQARGQSGGGQQGDSGGGDEGQALVEGDGGDDFIEDDGGDSGGMAQADNGDSDQGDGAPSGSGAGQSGAGSAPAPGRDGQGEGIGDQPGGQPLGKNETSPPPRGREREARVRGGSGPTRSQVIEAAAQRGFAQGAYDRVFTDYQAVVEEALEAGAVPEGRRYVVRRYFQLIRPRNSGAAATATAAAAGTPAPTPATAQPRKTP